MMNRKSQAALEFIMTYGWAILVVLVAVGALAYFGVLSPDRFLPSKCVMQSGIACLEHKVDANGGAAGIGQVQVRIQNSLGQDLTNVEARVGMPCGGVTVVGNVPNGVPTLINIDCTTGGTLTVTKFQGDFNISYQIGTSTITHLNVGEITSRTE